jgi:hypothetical protein
VLVRSDEAEVVARLSDVSNLTSRIFPDIGRAIEWAEDDLLEKHASVGAAELPLESISILRDFTAGQIGLLGRRADKPQRRREIHVARESALSFSGLFC